MTFRIWRPKPRAMPSQAFRVGRNQCGRCRYSSSYQSHFCTYLVPDVPLGLLALVRELGSERDLFALALLHRLLRGLLDPLELFLQRRGVTALETDFEESDKG